MWNCNPSGHNTGRSHTGRGGSRADIGDISSRQLVIYFTVIFIKVGKVSVFAYFALEKCRKVVKSVLDLGGMPAAVQAYLDSND